MSTIPASNQDDHQKRLSMGKPDPDTGVKLAIPIPLILGCLVLFAGALYILFTFYIRPGSTFNDESTAPSKMAADYAMWSTSMKMMDKSNEFQIARMDATDPTKKVTFKERWFVLPRENAVRAALIRRLPEEVKVTALTPLNYKESGGALSVTYQVSIELKSPLYLVPLTKLKLSDPSLKKYQSLCKYILATEDLPPGLTYEEAGAKQISEGQQTLTFPWKVKRAAVEDGKWRILDADPLFLQQNPWMEERLVMDSANKAMVMRTENEMKQMDATREAALNQFITRVKSIDEQVAAYRKERLSNVSTSSGKNSGKFGGSGSGEPTKSATRMVGGAATGAAIGAVASGGDAEATGIGAGAGLAAGAIYDIFSKSNDKKKHDAARDRENQKRRAAQNAAEKDIAEFQKKLIVEYEKELATLANARIQELKDKEGREPAAK